MYQIAPPESHHLQIWTRKRHSLKESIEVLIRFSNLNSASVLALAHFCIPEFSRMDARALTQVGFLEVANEGVDILMEHPSFSTG